MSNILEEVKKPLTERENFERTQRLWAMARTTPEADTYERNLMRMYEKALARIEALEAERRWIPVEEWMSNSENEMVNVTTWHSNFEEEFPVAYFSNGAWMEWNNGGRPGDDLPDPEFVRPLPSPPEGSADRAQERGANDKA